MAQTILVTGGAGFIGANFIEYWMQQYPYDQVVCVDKLTYAGHLHTLAKVSGDSRFSFYQVDVCDAKALEYVFQRERPQIVVHFAAESHVDRSIASPQVFWETNVMGTGTLLEVCRKYSVERYHQISTDEVYGDFILGDSHSRCTEEAPLRPSSPYSASKASADLLVQSYYRTYGLPVTISRCSNNYGPYQLPEKLIPHTIIRAMRNEPIPIYGNGQQRRNWLHVMDHCRAIERILSYGVVGSIYNVAGQAEVTNLNLVRQICQYMGKTEHLITFVADRLGHDQCYGIDSSKMQEELDWYEEEEFTQGLKKTVDWYFENTYWLSKLKK